MRTRIALAILILLISVAGYAQTFRGSINGTVTDQSGAVVASAEVKATNVGTDVTLTTTTTSDGVFAFQDLPLGTYKISVTAAGFKSETIDNVPVTAGNIYNLPVKLNVGSAGTTAIEVSAAALSLDTTTATLNDTISDAAVQDIPLNGRDFSQLIAVAPGYGGYSVGGFGSLNGTRANQMNWQIDGTDNNDFWHNIPAVNQGGVSGIAGTVMPIDAIDEFSAAKPVECGDGTQCGWNDQPNHQERHQQSSRQRLLLQSQRILCGVVPVLCTDRRLSQSAAPAKSKLRFYCRRSHHEGQDLFLRWL